MKLRSFHLLFALAGGLLLLFILLPLAALLISTTPTELGRTLGNAQVGRSLVLTFSASAIATLFCLLTGLPLSYLLARAHFPGRAWIESLIDLPVVLPHTAAGIALLLVFGSQGILGRLFVPLGIRFTDQLGGIVVGMAFVSLPYLVNMSRAAFQAIHPELEQAAAVDGASPWQIFHLITLPLAWRGIAGGMLMMWARGISEFGAVIILAYHPKIVPVLVFELFQGFGLKAALPVAVLLILIVLAVFGLLRAGLNRSEADNRPV
jgi:molybdate/tungstate transport system permease protein